MGILTMSRHPLTTLTGVVRGLRDQGLKGPDPFSERVDEATRSFLLSACALSLEATYRSLRNGYGVNRIRLLLPTKVHHTKLLRKRTIEITVLHVLYI